MINDTTSDLLTRIRNALLAKQPTVSVIHTKLNYEISKILKREGLINDLDVVSNNLLAGPNTSKTLLLTLKYLGQSQTPCINHLKRLSSSSLRIYSKAKDIPCLLNGIGIVIVSTSKGVMTDREAKSHNIGGELICSIW